MIRHATRNFLCVFVGLACWVLSASKASGASSHSSRDKQGDDRMKTIFVSSLEEESHQRRSLQDLTNSSNSVNGTDTQSSQPTAAPTLTLLNCTYESDDPIEFQKFIAIRLQGLLVDPVDLTLNETVSSAIERIAAIAYNAVSGCPENDETFRVLEEVSLLPNITTISDGVELILALNGSCLGCKVNDTAVFLRPEDTGSTISVEQEEENCFCSPPSRDDYFASFQRELTQETTFPNVQLVILEELVASDEEACQAELERPDISNGTGVVIEAETFTTLFVARVLFFGGRDNPAQSQLDILSDAVLQVYTDQASFTSRNCDPLRRQIDQVTAIDVGRGLSRNRRLRHHDNRYLQTSSFPAGVEVLFEITGTCVGCNSELFGEIDPQELIQSNISSSPLGASCLCPVDTETTGVSLVDFQIQFAEASNAVLEEVLDVAEVVPFPCDPVEDEFSTFVQIEFNLRPAAIQITQEELRILQDAFVAAYNVISRFFCDPFQRRLDAASVARTSDIASTVFGDQPFTIEFEVFGKCRGCDPTDILLYDSVTLLSLIDLGGDNRRLLDVLKQAGPGLLEGISNSPDFRSRVLQPGANDAACFCDVNAVPDQGPTEVDVVTTFSEFVGILNLPNIEAVGDCRALTAFSTSILLNFKSTGQGSTAEELLLLGQTFIDTYNRINSGDLGCDREFRQLTDFDIESDITLNEEFLEAGGFGGLDPSIVADGLDGRRKLLSRKISFELDSELQRRTQDQTTNSTLTVNVTIVDSDFEDDNGTSTNVSSVAPSTSPTFEIESVDPPSESPTFLSQDNGVSLSPTLSLIDTSVNVLLFVTGTCRGCSNQLGLFNQVSANRRQLQEQSTISLDFSTGGSCFCPLEAVQVAPSEEEIIQAFDESVQELKEEGAVTFVEEVQELEEVAVVECVIETNGFESELVIDFLGFFDGINDNDLNAVRGTFNTTYNRLSQNYCDELFRRSEEVGEVSFEQVSNVDESGVSRIRLTLSILGRCRDCGTSNDLFSSTSDPAPSRRRLQDDERCFCDAENRGIRAPKGEEFLEAFRSAWEDLSERRQLETRLLQAGGGSGSGSSNLISPVYASNADDAIIVTVSDNPSVGPSDAPTVDVSSFPSGEPSALVSNLPSAGPSALPSGTTAFPSEFPSEFPSAFPSDTLSSSPSELPSIVPSSAPSTGPSAMPSDFPSASPSDSLSNNPSTFPSFFPSAFPSIQPSSMPSTSPSATPSTAPSVGPSAGPSTSSSKPSSEPSSEPSLNPSVEPSDQPSVVPSFEPSQSPSFTPSIGPSQLPSIEPSQLPSTNPSVAPSQGPSIEPSQRPSTSPSEEPSQAPSIGPSDGPSLAPSAMPSRSPTGDPSIMPSSAPSNDPSSAPSSVPSEMPSTPSPSELPSIEPSDAPSLAPSDGPTSIPSSAPSDGPTSIPSTNPSVAPSQVPSIEPSQRPSTSPSEEPSQAPSIGPSDGPSLAPSAMPSRNPTGDPSIMPSSAPSNDPSSAPSSVPSEMPSTPSPSELPSIEPSDAPSLAPSDGPTSIPSSAPSDGPTSIPSSAPSFSPLIEGCFTGTAEQVINACVSENAGCCDLSSSCTFSGVQTVCPGSCTGINACAFQVQVTTSFTILENSCKGEGACESLQSSINNPSIGPDSCNGDFACVSPLGKPFQIFRNSCVGRRACAELGPTGAFRIGPDSCRGQSACKTGNGAYIIDQNSCVGGFSCRGQDGDVTDGLVGAEMTIGPNACRNPFDDPELSITCCTNIRGAEVFLEDGACQNTEEGSVGACANIGNDNAFVDIFNDSCGGSESCLNVGNNQAAPFPYQIKVGISSCQAPGSCRNVGGDNSLSVKIGLLQGSEEPAGFACVDVNACTDVGALAVGVTIRDGSCTGPDACNEVGAEAQEVTIGKDACTGPNACTSVGPSAQQDVTIAAGACASASACNQCQLTCPGTVDIPDDTLDDCLESTCGIVGSGPIPPETGG